VCGGGGFVVGLYNLLLCATLNHLRKQ